MSAQPLVIIGQGDNLRTIEAGTGGPKRSFDSLALLCLLVTAAVIGQLWSQIGGGK